MLLLLYLDDIIIAGYSMHDNYLNKPNQTKSYFSFYFVLFLHKYLKKLIQFVGTKCVSQNHLLSFDDNNVLKIINWIC